MTDESFLPFWVILRKDGGPSDALADAAREPRSDEWACRVSWHLGSATAVPAGVELVAPAGEAVGASEWRWVRVASVISHSRDLLEAVAHVGGIEGSNGTLAEDLRASVPSESKRRGLPSAHFEWVASAYNRAVAASNPFPVRAVRIAALRDGWGSRATDAAVRGWIRECKKRGLITATARSPRSRQRKGPHK